MRVLSLTQPWAELVVLGEKRVETRDWATGYRGPLLIHASKGYPRAAQVFRNDSVVEDALRRHGLLVSPLPLGAIIGSVELVDCVPVDSEKWRGMVKRVDPREWIWGNLEPGQNPQRVAWMLQRARKLPVAIPAAGSLGLWTWELPGADEAALRGGG